MKTITLLALLAAPAADYSPTITHPYLPLSAVPRAEFERAGKKRVVVVRRVEEEFIDGALHETARNYFAQKDGAVWYFGEDVDNYKGGKIVDHDGSWKVGKDAKEPFLFMPAQPRKGDIFKPEDVKGIAEDVAEILAVGEKVGDYDDVLKIKFTIVLDKEVKIRYFAKGVGFIREEEGDKILELKKIVRR